MKTLAFALIVSATACAAQAQTVYRCGTQYSQEPCKNGTTVNAQDMRTPEQQQQAREAAARDEVRARQMAKERRAEAAAQRPATASGIKHQTTPAVGQAKPKVEKAPTPKKQKKQKIKKPGKADRKASA
jgi:hypothetical protein